MYFNLSLLYCGASSSLSFRFKCLYSVSYSSYVYLIRPSKKPKKQKRLFKFLVKCWIDAMIEQLARLFPRSDQVKLTFYK